MHACYHIKWSLLLLNRDQNANASIDFSENPQYDCYENRFSRSEATGYDVRKPTGSVETPIVPTRLKTDAERLDAEKRK